MEFAGTYWKGIITLSKLIRHGLFSKTSEIFVTSMICMSFKRIKQKIKVLCLSQSCDIWLPWKLSSEVICLKWLCHQSPNKCMLHIWFCLEQTENCRDMIVWKCCWTEDGWKLSRPKSCQLISSPVFASGELKITIYIHFST